MLEKLEKFWAPINIGLWVTILANLGTGIFILIKAFETFVWIEAFSNVFIAIVILIWLTKLHKVLSFDTTMAENYALKNYGNDDESQEGLALQDSLKQKEKNKKYIKSESISEKADVSKKPLSDWPPFAGIDHPSLDPYGYIDALIKNSLFPEAEKRLQEAVACHALESEKASLLWEELKESRK